LMQSNVQNSTSTTLPLNLLLESSDELIHSTAPARDGIGYASFSSVGSLAAPERLPAHWGSSLNMPSSSLSPRADETPARSTLSTPVAITPAPNSTAIPPVRRIHPITETEGLKRL